MTQHPPNLLETLSPCGLDCGRCLAKAGGEIESAARALLDKMEGFEKHAQRFTAMDPVFKGYPSFLEVAGRLASGTCNGCRHGGCLNTACRVHTCVAEQGVGFCFECSKFPCDQSGLSEPLLSRWKRNNELMRDLGPEAFLAESLKRPRY